MRKLLVLLVTLIIFLGLWSTVEKYAPTLTKSLQKPNITSTEKIKIVTEESVVTDVVKKYGPSVVTVSEEIQTESLSPFDLGPFSIFGLPQQEDQQPTQPQNIGTGFIINNNGLVVTNKHVVSDTNSKYQIITNNDKKYDVQKIYRDPLNDVALLKIDPGQNPGETLQSVELGDSSKLQVGQFVIAIGTALGEFRSTVTTGVISGLGRGITAGSSFQGYAERLDNVIQTDAAINPGNSGGPLLNSSGQVIGVNTAIAQSGQNIGFALPINVIKDSLNNFNETGQFNRPYLGVGYKMIDKSTALENSVPEGAYVRQVVKDSPASKVGIKKGDIITKIDGERIQGDTELGKIIAKKKVGDIISLDVFRSGKTQTFKSTLESAPNQ